jgi:hypothetical protein
MKTLVAGLSLLFVSCMALSAYSLNLDAQSAAKNADSAMTPDSGTSGVGEEP